MPPECGATSFDNVIIGTAGADTLRGENGRRDLIFGHGGDDKLYGDSQDDCLVGGSGNDELSGDSGKDVLIGGSGDDVLSAGGLPAKLEIRGPKENGKDVLYGGDGHDTCYSGNAHDGVSGCEVVNDHKLSGGGPSRSQSASAPPMGGAATPAEGEEPSDDAIVE